MSVIFLIGTISPPSSPVVGPPKLVHSDQLQIQPGVGERVIDFGVEDVAEEIVEELKVDVIVSETVDMLELVDELWTVGIVVDCIGKLVDDILEAVGIGDFVEKFPQFLSQQNTLIS